MKITIFLVVSVFKGPLKPSGPVGENVTLNPAVLEILKELKDNKTVDKSKEYGLNTYLSGVAKICLQSMFSILLPTM